MWSPRSSEACCFSYLSIRKIYKFVQTLMTKSHHWFQKRIWKKSRNLETNTTLTNVVKNQPVERPCKLPRKQSNITIRIIFSKLVSRGYVLQPPNYNLHMLCSKQNLNQNYFQNLVYMKKIKHSKTKISVFTNKW